MSNIGSPKLNSLIAPNLRIGIIAASWHDRIMTGLIAGAQEALSEAQVTDSSLIRVPGTFELPGACAAVIDDFDALVALGVVIRGDTPHFDYVCQAAAIGITNLSVSSKKPIGFGVLTCDDEAQALARSGLVGSFESKGYEAAQAAIATVLATR